MDSPPPSFSLFSLTCSDTEKNLMAVLSIHVVSGRKMAGSSLPSGWGPDRDWRQRVIFFFGYPHPVASFQRIVCTWWTWAKFKHTVPDSSSQQLHYPWCAQAPGEEPAKCCTFNFLDSPSPSSHHSCTHMFFLILLFTLTHSWLSHLCPKNRNLKLLVVPTINLVISQPLLYLPPLTHTHTCRCFLLAGCWGT